MHDKCLYLLQPLEFFASIRLSNNPQLFVVNRRMTSATLVIFKALVSVTHFLNQS
jgi:hypothetical protein